MFEGNSQLRSATEEIRTTPEMIEEMVRCSEDVIYFAQRYCYIVTIDDGKRIIRLWDHQKRMLKAFTTPPNEKRHIIVLAPRQCAKTTTAAIYLVHRAIFNKDKSIAILANKEKTAIEIMSRVKMLFEGLPVWMQPGVVDGGWNKSTIGLANGTRMFAASTSSSAIRGWTISDLYIDEFAFVPPHVAEEFMSSVYPTIASGKTSRVIISSCVTGDTYVFTDRGIQQIRDVVQPDQHGAYQVSPYKVAGHGAPRAGTVMFNNGVAETRIIHTPHASIEGTLNHKLWTANTDGTFDWRETSAINVGDYVVVRCGQDLWGNNDSVDMCVSYGKRRKTFELQRLTTDWAYFLGLFLAEGSVYLQRNKKHKVVSAAFTITCGDSDHVKSLLNRLNLTYYSDGIRHTVSHLGIYHLLQALGFDLSKKAKEKIIPARLLQLSRVCSLAMLQGLFDGDGTATKWMGRVAYTSTSKQLVDQIRMLLLNVGIIGTVVTQLSKPTSRVKVYSTNHVLSLDKHNSLTFYKTVGFRLQRKQQMQPHVCCTSKHTNRVDIIPYSNIFLRQMKRRYKALKSILSGSALAKQGIFCSGRKHHQHLTRSFWLRVRPLINMAEMPEMQLFYENVDDQLRWNRVTRIEQSRAETYDFSLQDIKDDRWCHSVLYNGIVGHQTPRGMNHFYHLWTAAVRNKNNFFPVKIKWNEVPGRDDEWRRNILKDIDPVQFAQEFLCKFIGSSSTLVDPDVLESLSSKDAIDMKWEGALRIFQQPIEGKKYVMGVDSAEGVGMDSSVIQVLCIHDEFRIEQVAIFRDNRMDANTFAQKVKAVGDYYNQAMIMIETNNVGDVVARALWYDLEYENMVNLQTKGFGVRATHKSKVAAAMLLKHYMEHRQLTIYDQRTIYELSIFTEVAPGIFRADAERGYDDTVTALYWALYYLMTASFDSRRGEAMQDQSEMHALTTCADDVARDFVPLTGFSSAVDADDAEDFNYDGVTVVS